MTNNRASYLTSRWPSGNWFNSLLLKITIEIVDLPIIGWWFSIVFCMFTREYLFHRVAISLRFDFRWHTPYVCSSVTQVTIPKPVAPANALWCSWFSEILFGCLRNGVCHQITILSANMSITIIGFVLSEEFTSWWLLKDILSGVFWPLKRFKTLVLCPLFVKK